jgi:Protein of unknown function (DUF3489)
MVRRDENPTPREAHLVIPVLLRISSSDDNAAKSVHDGVTYGLYDGQERRRIRFPIALGARYTVDGRQETARNAKAQKKALKTAKKAGSSRDGSKAAKIIDLLKRPNGATLAEIMKATDWQAHSVRGFISTSVKKHSVKIESSKNETGERTYKISK